MAVSAPLPGHIWPSMCLSRMHRNLRLSCRLGHTQACLLLERDDLSRARATWSSTWPGAGCECGLTASHGGVMRRRFRVRSRQRPELAHIDMSMCMAVVIGSGYCGSVYAEGPDSSTPRMPHPGQAGETRPRLCCGRNLPPKLKYPCLHVSRLLT